MRLAKKLDWKGLKRLNFEILVQTQIRLYYCPLLAATGLGQQLQLEGYNRRGQAIPVQDWAGP
jgi:hypothetical protein